jgi:hypothetical protein
VHTHISHISLSLSLSLSMLFHAFEHELFDDDMMFQEKHGGHDDDQVDAKVVKEAVLQAIQNWSEISEQK